MSDTAKTELKKVVSASAHALQVSRFAVWTRRVPNFDMVDVKSGNGHGKFSYEDQQPLSNRLSTTGASGLFIIPSSSCRPCFSACRSTSLGAVSHIHPQATTFFLLRSASLTFWRLDPTLRSVSCDLKQGRIASLPGVVGACGYHSPFLTLHTMYSSVL